MIRIAVLVSALAVICPTKLSAQTYHSLPRVLELPASTRAMALGGAYMTNSPQADVLFYNPALLVGVQSFGLDIQQWGTAGWTSTAVAARQWFDNLRLNTSTFPTYFLMHNTRILNADSKPKPSCHAPSRLRWGVESLTSLLRHRLSRN